MGFLKRVFILTLVGIAGGLYPGWSQDGYTVLAMNGFDIQNNADRVELKKIIRDIEDKYKINFAYQAGLLDNKFITVSENPSMSLGERLYYYLSQNSLDYQKVGEKNYVIYKKKPKSGMNKPLTRLESRYLGVLGRRLEVRSPPISGTVTNKIGEPLIGVNVLVKGTNKGTATDFEGNFTLEDIDDNAVLVVSYIGYKTQEVSVAGKTTLKISLVSDSELLDEVVVVGYGTVLRKDNTTATSSLNSEELEDIPITNAGQAMAARISGIQLQQTSGVPGSAPVIRIRGFGSISASNDPLYIIDGVPTNAAFFNSLNPSDIQRIDVLKDAAATAIYGSRGGNGIIIVKTKRGFAKKSIDFNISMYKGFSQVSKQLDLLNSSEFVEMATEAYNAGGVDIPGIFNDPSKWSNTDWQDIIFQNARIENYNISAGGGTENINYFFSGGYLQEEGIVIGNDFDRINFNAKIDAKLSEKLSISLDILPSFTTENWRSNSGLTSNNVVAGNITVPPSISGAITMPPLIPVKYENGDYGQPNIDPYLKGSFILQNLYNPLAGLEQFKGTTKSGRFFGKINLKYQIVEGLVFSSLSGGTYTNYTKNAYRNSIIANRFYQFANVTTPDVESVKAFQSTGHSYDWLWSNTLNFNRQYGDHSIGIVAGIESQKNFFEENELESIDGAIVNDYIDYISNSSDNTSTADKGEWSIASYLGRISYDLQNKYYISAAFRRDKSSRFGPDKRTAYFPSVSLAWRISDENLLNSFGWLSELKLRSSYGKTGNFDGFGNYAWSSTMSKTSYVFGENAVTGYSPGNYSDNGLTWETAHQVNIGLDWGFLEDRIFLTVDAYNRRTDGLISRRPIPAIGGFGNDVITNIGAIDNKGLEFDLITRNRIKDLIWTTNFNISFNRNKVVELVNDQILYSSPIYGWFNTHRIMEGRPIGDIYGYIADGVFLNQAEVNAGPQWQGDGSRPGDIRYKDVNGDGLINPDDITLIGNAQPKFVYGFSNTLKYKNFDLRIVVKGMQGGKIMNGVLRFEDTYQGRNNGHKRLLNRWQSENNPGNGLIPRLTTNTAEGGNNVFSSRHVFDASFLRIQFVVLGYKLKNEWLEKVNLKDTRIYLAADNLFTFSKYFGYSPEANEDGGLINAMGVDHGTYPLPRKINIGVNIKF